MALTFTMVSGACIGCRERKETSTNSPARTLQQSTNTTVKWPDNVAGRFFVMSSCIDCDLGEETAPAHFKRNEKEGYAFVYNQPASEAELNLCVKAAEGCPVEAIVDTVKQPK